jgi:hypothetical protein
MPSWLIWAIVIVVLIVIAAVVISMTSKRRASQRRERAEELRQEASAHASGLTESQRQTEELRAKADLAKAEARRAEERAATAATGHQVNQAAYEDKLREADKLDPDVNTRAKDYEPDVWSDSRSETVDGGSAGTATSASSTSTSTSGASHNAEGDAPTAPTSSGTSTTEPQSSTGPRHADTQRDPSGT